MLPSLLLVDEELPFGGGSRVRHLVKAAQQGRLKARILGVACPRIEGGINAFAKEVPDLGFFSIVNPADPQGLDRAVTFYRPDFVLLAEWHHPVHTEKLDPRTTVQVFPAPLPFMADERGPLMEAVLREHRERLLDYTEVCMRFVAPDGRGPVFYRHEVEIPFNATPQGLYEQVNFALLARIVPVMNAVLSGEIKWDGTNPASLQNHFMGK